MNWSWSSFIAYRVTGNRITTALLSHGSQHVPQQFTFTALLQGFQKLFSGFSSVSFFDAGLTKSRLWPLEVCSEILASMMLLYDLYVLLLAHAHLYVILPSFLHVAALAQTCPWTHGKCTLTKLWDIWTGRQYQIVPTHSILFHRGQHFPTSSSALALAAASACFCSSMDEKFWPGFRIFLWPYRLETCFLALHCGSALKCRQTFICIHLDCSLVHLNITTACPWTAVTKSRSKRFLFEMSPHVASPWDKIAKMMTMNGPQILFSATLHAGQPPHLALGSFSLCRHGIGLQRRGKALELMAGAIYGSRWFHQSNTKTYNSNTDNMLTTGDNHWQPWQPL